jgi:pimeloyl-ACP methyl ester carboxylesterase
MLNVLKAVLRGRMRGVGAVLTVVVAGLAGTAAWAATSLPAPTSDPFYSPTGAWQSAAPGSVLKVRQVKITLAGTADLYSGTEVLYRTTNQLGEPSATVATIIHPLASGPMKLLSYQTFYDGDASTCRPSYTLQSDNPSNTSGDLDEPFMLAYLSQGFTVVTSDYEGPTDDYGAGRESGENSLDAIRAAEGELKLTPKTTPVALLGYSGGATATEWAAELQPTYAPGLDIIGSAAGGIPDDFWRNLAYINGSSDWAGAMPSVLLGLMRAYKLDIDKYLSAEGRQIIAAVSQGCLNPAAYPGLHYQDMFKPQYQNFTKVPIFTRIFNDSIMGRLSVPRGPQLMAVGHSDATGDGVMVTKDVQQLAYEYCQRDANVELHVYDGADHDAAAGEFEPQALSFLDELYDGQVPSDGCSSITPGDPLTPVPMPAQVTSPKLALRAVHANARRTAVTAMLLATDGVARDVTVKLARGRRVIAKVVIARLTAKPRRVRLRTSGHTLRSGRYSIVVLLGKRRTISRTLSIR